MSRSAVLALCLAAACGSSPPPAASPATGPTPTEVTPGGASTPGAAAGPHTITLRFGPRTDVMDTPRGQLEKAEHALRESALARELTAMGYEVAYAGDVKLAGDVVILDAEGTEFGRGELRAVTGDKDVPAGLLDAARAHAPKPE